MHSGFSTQPGKICNCKKINIANLLFADYQVVVHGSAHPSRVQRRNFMANVSKVVFDMTAGSVTNLSPATTKANPPQIASETGNPHPVDVHVGKRLRMLRVAARRSQTDIARAVGVTFQQMQKYERAMNRVSASMLYELAAALGCGITDLFPPGAEPSGSANDVLSLLTNPAAMRLIRAFAKIENLKLRNAIVTMVEAASPAEAEIPPTPSVLRQTAPPSRPPQPATTPRPCGAEAALPDTCAGLPIGQVGRPAPTFPWAGTQPKRGTT